MCEFYLTNENCQNDKSAYTVYVLQTTHSGIIHVMGKLSKYILDTGTHSLQSSCFAMLVCHAEKAINQSRFRVASYNSILLSEGLKQYVAKL